MADKEKGKFSNFWGQVVTLWNQGTGLVNGASAAPEAIESWMKAMLVTSIVGNVIAATSLIVNATKKSK